MRRSTMITAACFETYALILANVQGLGGVRTDESKYLLNIGYPHPPAVRWLMGTTDALPFQEMLWRILFATILIQAAWLVWDMARDLHSEDRFLVTGSWLLSTGVILWAGSLYLSGIAAVVALVCLWARTHPRLVRRWPAPFALLWLFGLFACFQTVLFAPLVWLALRPTTKRWTAVVVMVPVLLLALYVFSHPLIAAGILYHKDNGAVLELGSRIAAVARLLGMAGSGIVTVLGILGLVLSGFTFVALSFLLVAAYAGASVPNAFYAVLFVPLLVAGVQMLLEGRSHPQSKPLLAAIVGAALVMSLLNMPSRTSSVARIAMHQLGPKLGTGGTLLIGGSFGHEWQYESPIPVARYVPKRLPEAKAVICLEKCDPPVDARMWKMVQGVSVETWVKK